MAEVQHLHHSAHGDVIATTERLHQWQTLRHSSAAPFMHACCDASCMQIDPRFSRAAGHQPDVELRLTNLSRELPMRS